MEIERKINKMRKKRERLEMERKAGMELGRGRRE